MPEFWFWWAIPSLTKKHREILFSQINVQFFCVRISDKYYSKMYGEHGYIIHTLSKIKVINVYMFSNIHKKSIFTSAVRFSHLLSIRTLKTD